MATLPADVRGREQALAAALYEAGEDAPAAASGTDRVISAAIDQQRVLGLHYTDRAGQRTERDVEPLGLLRSPQGWYLIAHCRLRGAVRGFRLSSVTAAALRDERVPARDPAGLRRDLRRFDARSLLPM